MALILCLRLVAGLLTGLACCLSATLIYVHYHTPCEAHCTRLSIALIAMVPIYAIGSFMLVLMPSLVLYVELFRETYQALGLYLFSRLLLYYFARRAPLYFSQPDLYHEAEKCEITAELVDANTAQLFELCDYYRAPCSIVVVPSAQLLDRIRLALLQYLMLRVVSAVFLLLYSELVTDYQHRDLSSSTPYFWLSLLMNVSLTIALVALYLQVKLMAPVILRHWPWLKFAAIKLLVAILFWQSLLYSFLATFDVLPFALFVPWNKAETTEALQSTLACFELAWLAFYQLWIFAP